MEADIRAKLRKIFVVTAFIGILGAGIYIFNSVSEAYTEQIGTVTGSYVRLRSEPVTGSLITYPDKGQVVRVIDETTASDGYTWYKLTYDSNGATLTGWMRSDFVLITVAAVDPSDDNEFEAYLENQGFPESYRVYLRALHAQHPNWVFNAKQTGLDWNTVINEESKLGINLVSSSSPSSWKSTEPGAYNWDTGKWVAMDTSSWVAASKEIVAYFMDPRNFLVDGSAILQFETLSYAATQNKTGIANILAGSFMAKDTYYNIFYNAGVNNNISPYHLASRSLQEVGTNGSGSTSGTYPGYEGVYNFFNIGASPNADGSGALVNGLIRAQKEGWTSPQLSIEGGAKIVGNSYIYKGQNTLYYQKFNVVYTGGYGLYRHQYMTNIQAPTSESTKMKKAYTDFASSAITFNIPVYKNMPETVAAKPTKDGSPYNLLTAVSVDGYSLTPYFDKNQEEYSLIVASDVSSINVKASTLDGCGASISGTGNVDLNPGENVISIICTAQNGNAKTYVLNVVRLQPENSGDTVEDTAEDTTEDTAEDTTVPEESDEVSYTSPYDMGSNISGIELGSNTEQVISNFITNGCRIKIVDSKGTVKSGVVGTGDVIQIYVEDVLSKEYPVVIYGDVTGDGAIDGLDLLYVKRHTLNIKAISGIYAIAGDANKSNDNVINSLDLLYIKRHILDIKKISQ